MTAVHCATAVVDGIAERDVRVTVSSDGVIVDVTAGQPARPGDLRLGTVLAGSGDAHSHAFHRVLRGRTHDDGGDFWRWRESMYAVAARLEPDSYRRLATAVFAEMLAAGWTAVGEFHYVHHRPDGSPYPESEGGPNAMGLALAAAARDVGIRLVLLDTCYLRSGPDSGTGAPLAPEQRRFGDGTVSAWLDRWRSLRAALADDPVVTVGAAVHSVRAVPPASLAEVAEGLPADVPLHVHLSEQRAENAATLAAHGMSPTALLDRAGLLTSRLSVVHATHLEPGDVERLGRAGVTAVFCPTTEADLGDGIGPARALAAAGVRIALGSDQNAVVDPFLESRGLEAGERLAGERRGVFPPASLDRARSTDGYASIGLVGGIRRGAACDLVEVDPASARTVGSAPTQLLLSATASDVLRVVVGGRVVADRGRLADGRTPATLLATALEALS